MLGVADIWSPMSVLTVSGVIYLIALFVMFFKRGLIAWGWMWWLLVGGTILVGLSSPDSGGDIDDAYRNVRPTNNSLYDHMYFHEGKWTKGRDLLRNDVNISDDQEPVYRWSIGIFRYIFHPGCIFWCPLIVMVLAIPLWLLFRVPWFGSEGMLGK